MSELTPEQKETIETEEKILGQVLHSLNQQISTSRVRLQTESERARELTSDIVNSRRVEDKAMLASDEAVSHALRDNKSAEIATIEKLLEKPYFARVIVEEERNGDLKEFEYRIGFHANIDCRIIDWRTAPLSKLYYEYKEGEDYSEQIQGQERSGQILLRNRLDIEKRHIHRISCRYGDLVKENGDWHVQQSRNRARSGGSQSKLPSILSLITPEQFRAITEEAKTAILIQGIAGSGKTTVALHRLSWMLHENNSDASPSECVILVKSKLLKNYVINSLPLLEVESVPVYTFSEWCWKALGSISPTTEYSPTPCPLSVDRVKRSLALLIALEESMRNVSLDNSESAYVDHLIKILQRPKNIIQYDETRLMNEELIERTRLRFEENRTAGIRDMADDALYLRCFELSKKGVTLPSGFVGQYKHLIVDEVQDFSAAELASVIGAVRSTQDLTLVGDTAQSIDRASAFPGWEKLMKHWQFGSEMSRYITLEMSHRSTLPIMKLAEHIQKRSTVKDGRPGRTPIWFKCSKETQGVTSVIEWLQRAIDKYPSQLTAVLCRTGREAKYALSLLSPTFGQAIRLGDEDALSFEEGIIVAEVAEVKGLEFCNVLLWNPSKRSYSEDPLERNLLYVAATRAEENLALVTWERASPFLPSFQSPIIRVYDLAIDDEDE